LKADDIQRHASGVSLAKSVAIIQVSWKVMQLIGRWINRFLVSQLEISTLGFSASAMCQSARPCSDAFLGFCPFIYFVCRAYIIIETFRRLFYLLPDAFIDT